MGTKKTIYYEIGDPLLRFWYYFIFDNIEMIKIHGSIIYDKNLEEINKFLSYGFEDVARLYMEYLNSQGKLGDAFPSFKPYRVEHSILKRSIEIDGLSNNDKTLIVIECKYRKEPFNIQMYNHLKESVSVFPNKYNRVYYLFSKNGFTKELLNNKDSNCNLVNLEAMFNLK